MKIAVATDYIGSTGSPERPLRLLAEAGFTHLHWCHQWCTDFLYSKYEMAEYKRLLKELDLTLLDIHGSQGREKCWYSLEEYQRKSGVELVINRIEMMTELEAAEGGAVMMHFPVIQYNHTRENIAHIQKQMDAFRKTLDELMPVLEKHNRKIALENMWSDLWITMREILTEYPAERIGVCYDSGHANSNTLKQMDFLEENKDRLEALHLHDNDGNGDLHQPPFSGSVDWERLAGIIGTSKSYTRPVSFELAMCNTPFYDREKSEKNEPQTDEAVRAFLADAYQRCLKFANMVQDVRTLKQS